MAQFIDGIELSEDEIDLAHDMGLEDYLEEDEGEERKVISCPKCNFQFLEGTGALSRRDNKTEICSDCGIREAMEDYENNK